MTLLNVSKLIYLYFWSDIDIPPTRFRSSTWVIGKPFLGIVCSEVLVVNRANSDKLFYKYVYKEVVIYIICIHLLFFRIFIFIEFFIIFIYIIICSFIEFHIIFMYVHSLNFIFVYIHSFSFIFMLINSLNSLNVFLKNN